MNYGRLALATLGGIVAYFATGGAIFGLVPQMASEFEKHAALYRPREGGDPAPMAAGMVALLVAIFVVTMLYTMTTQGASGVAQGMRFGVLVGLFVVCAFVLHNYMLLNIGLTLTLMQAAAYFIQWTVVGTVIGLVYKRSA